MSNGASRIFNVMRKSGTNTISEIVYLTVRSTNPLTLSLDDRLILNENFVILSDSIDKNKLSVGDKLLATSFNDGQRYFVNQAVSSKNGLKSGVVDDLTSSSTTDSLSANQGRIIKQLIDNLDERLKKLEPSDN